MAYSSGYQFGSYHLTPWVKRLIIANLAVFILTWAVPSLVNYLAFVPRRVVLQPWGVVTYMFVHGGFWHLFFNLLGLFFFGPPIEDRWGSKEFIKFYLICGLGGAALSFLFAMNSAVVGASAAVYGVMLAFAMMWPDVPIYLWGIFPVKAKWLVIALAALSFFSAFGGSADGTAHFAHLGGFAAGFLYIKIDSATGNPMQKLQRMVSRRRLKVIPGQLTKREEPRTRRRVEEEMQDEIDRVLDKISSHGMASLTADERKVLEEVSKRYRQS
jgi:membrane associated rhomboid family serine protease